MAFSVLKFILSASRICTKLIQGMRCMLSTVLYDRRQCIALNAQFSSEWTCQLLSAVLRGVKNLSYNYADYVSPNAGA